jgi:uncharacterized protein YciI
MLYMAVCYDKPEGRALRLANRAAHLDFLRANDAFIKVCGPILADDNEAMIGSLLIVEAPDRATADALLARDPYSLAGLFRSVDVRPWRWVIGSPNG